MVANILKRYKILALRHILIIVHLLLLVTNFISLVFLIHSVVFHRSLDMVFTICEQTICGGNYGVVCQALLLVVYMDLVAFLMELIFTFVATTVVETFINSIQ